MMQAIVDVVDAAPDFTHGGKNHALKRFQRFAFEMSFRDAGLIGDDRDAEAEVIEEANRFGNTREELELRARERSIDDSGVVMVDESVDDAIAVE